MTIRDALTARLTGLVEAALLRIRRRFERYIKKAGYHPETRYMRGKTQKT